MKLRIGRRKPNITIILSDDRSLKTDWLIVKAISAEAIAEAELIVKASS